MKIAEIVKWKCFWKLISILQPFLPLLLSLLAWKVLNTAAFHFEWHTLHNFGDWLTIIAGMAQPWTAISLDRGPSASHVMFPGHVAEIIFSGKHWSCRYQLISVIDWLLTCSLIIWTLNILGSKSLSKSWFKISTKLQPNCSCTN